MAEKSKIAAKTAGRRKPAARNSTSKRKPAARKSAGTASPEFAARAQEAGRNAFLAGLGFYGKAFDQAQEQFNSIRQQLQARRKRTDRLYQELVKRGKKVEKDAKGAIRDIDLPRIELDSLTDRTKFEKQLEKARVRFEELKQAVGFKSAV